MSRRAMEDGWLVLISDCTEFASEDDGDGESDEAKTS